MLRSKTGILFVAASLCSGPAHAQYNYNHEIYYYKAYMERLNGPLVPQKTPLQDRYAKSRKDDYSTPNPPQVKPGELPDYEQASNPFTPDPTKIDHTREQIKLIEAANRAQAYEAAQEARKEKYAEEIEERKKKKEIAHKKLEKELFAAIYAGDVKAVRLCLNKGLDPNLVHDGYTPLHYAASLRKPEVISMLLENPKVNIGTEENRYFTLLHWAAYENRMDIVRKLVHRGAKIGITDDRGKTPLDYAAGQRHKELEAYLRERM